MSNVPTPPNPALSHRIATYQRLRALFDAILEQPAEVREAWIDTHIADTEDRAALRRLLAADATAGYLETPAVEHATRLDSDDTRLIQGLVGQRIGAFRLLHLLGQGGMAAVFLGERVEADFHQRAAVKLLRCGLYSELDQRLFQRERQALAVLEHPNIARLIDGGVTDAGIPYLVMEYVDGQTIIEHAAARPLGLRKRLRLFIAVARAVEHAHQRLIVHRDLKPANILVTAGGTVKLLDFGIAKLLDEDDAGATRTGLAALTPGYAAPEQFTGGPLSTATDVYALGVLLHELLLEHRPGEPLKRPSARLAELAIGTWTLPLPRPLLRRALTGDLDNIVLKALAAEPQRRYASAGALADDIERHLQAQPVMAHPPSHWYRTRKFVQRHRGGVAMSAVLTISLVASLGLALWQAKVADHQAQIAQREAERANTVRDFVVQLFDSARASLPRDQRPTPDMLVAQAQQRLARAAPLDAATQVDLRRTLAEVWLSLSAFDDADAALAEAQIQALALNKAEIVRELQVLRADGWQRAGRHNQAAAEIIQVIAPLRSGDSPLLLRALGVLAAARLAQGNPTAAIELQREALAVAEGRHGPGSLEALAAALELGNLLAAGQHYPMAKAVLSSTLVHWRTTNAPEDARYVGALASLAVTTDALGELTDSETHLRELLALKQRIYPMPHDSIAKSLRDLGQLLARGTDPKQAEALLIQALAMQRAVLGPDHREIAATHDALGVLMAGQRRFEPAEEHYRDAIAICSRLGLHDEVCPRARNNLGMTFYRQGRLDEAEMEMTAALSARRTLFVDDHPTIAYSLSTLANVAAAKGEFERSVALSRQSLTLLDRLGHGRAREAILARHGLAQALFHGGQLDQALVEIDRALADWREQAPDSKVRQVMILVEKGQIQRALGDLDGVRMTRRQVAELAVPDTELALRTRELLAELALAAADAAP